VKQSAIPAAITVSGLALPLLALPFGWRPTVALCGAAALAVGAVTTRRAWTRERPPAPTADAPAPPRATLPLLLLAVGAAFASFGPAALGAFLVASAVDAGMEEGSAGVLLAAGSALSLIARVGLGERADRRADYGFRTVSLLLVSGSLGYALIATGAELPLVLGALVAFTLGWGWPGLFNLAVVDRHRSAPAAATGITQAGIYVGAAAGPAAFGLLVSGAGFSFAWVLMAATALLAAFAVAIAQSRFGKPVPGTTAARARAGIRHI
jgi:predicted MFS family arabinose efflux permease